MTPKERREEALARARRGFEAAGTRFLQTLNRRDGVRLSLRRARPQMHPERRDYLERRLIELDKEVTMGEADLDRWVSSLNALDRPERDTPLPGQGKLF